MAAALGVGVYDERCCGPWRYRKWESPRDRKTVAALGEERRGERSRVWLPPVVPSGPAGAPAPRPLTRWRVQAIRLCIRLRERGHVTSEDFRELGVAAATWRDRWVRRAGFEGSRARYVAVEGADLPDAGFEAEAAAIRDLDQKK